MVTAFVLAGGKSSRMGADKAFLKFQRTTLLDRAAGIARLVADKVYISGPREKFGPEALEDVFPNCGPLGGIHAALKSSASELNLVLAVDLPFVEADFLRYLLRQAKAEVNAGAPLAVVPRVAQGWQPLCAVYHKDFAEAAEKALREKRYKIDWLFSQVPVRAVEEAEILKAGFSPGMFDNLNTREEFELAQQRLL
ncbi:MAG TPA: molybdenum cofactor guanylyltransferase [Terriglobales bacterium]|nr:molybdenum cofactor guanylyltransferase [Terriglobales bacterium]